MGGAVDQAMLGQIVGLFMWACGRGLASAGAMLSRLRRVLRSLAERSRQ